MKGDFNKLINSEKPVLVDFYAEWCGPCKMQAPILKEVAGQVNGKARIIKVDVDKNQNLANKYQVKGVPTLILFKNGAVKWRQSGLVDKARLTKIIEENTD
ncbi:MAG: thioredoxin [Muricauda sp.]|nr:thioredoxin [Allomuricauda sp.]MAU25906.1 thioredoxin [Allomuricauda sp.]MBC30342.1 thioredoxin [Allomuricauda sp.]|tara:strand:- start:1037 stop:1339 length:303 start_codon:yes stop_codon:yes gene_type:complete